MSRRKAMEPHCCSCRSSSRIACAPMTTRCALCAGAGEGFGFIFVIDVENEQSAVDGFGERAGKNELTAFVGFAGEAQVLFAKRGAARDHVVDEFVEQGVVVHCSHLFR